MDDYTVLSSEELQRIVKERELAKHGFIFVRLDGKRYKLTGDGKCIPPYKHSQAITLVQVVEVK